MIKLGPGDLVVFGTDVYKYNSPADFYGLDEGHVDEGTPVLVLSVFYEYVYAFVDGEAKYLDLDIEEDLVLGELDTLVCRLTDCYEQA